nr:hypothetical protein Iba_chr14aCG18180 [Ipomoea batatas]GMD89387.1 hypothetical protein Iba_chr14cCG16310 [Ipomoea batatas]
MDAILSDSLTTFNAYGMWLRSSSVRNVFMEEIFSCINRCSILSWLRASSFSSKYFIIQAMALAVVSCPAVIMVKMLSVICSSVNKLFSSSPFSLSFTSKRCCRKSSYFPLGPIILLSLIIFPSFLVTPFLAWRPL